jgi:rRNA maturation RNase YbeY
MKKKNSFEINIYNEHASFEFNEVAAKNIILRVAHEKGLQPVSITVIWVDDAYLKNLHAEYLNDATETDVMTFNLADFPEIEGEIYISVDRAVEHANMYQTSPESELARLIIHGMLHLAGMDDHSEADAAQMRKAEDYFIDLLNGDIANFFK